MKLKVESGRRKGETTIGRRKRQPLLFSCQMKIKTGGEKMTSEVKRELEKLALKIRIGTVECIKSRGFGHIGGSRRS